MSQLPWILQFNPQSIRLVELGIKGFHLSSRHQRGTIPTSPWIVRNLIKNCMAIKASFTILRVHGIRKDLLLSTKEIMTIISTERSLLFILGLMNSNPTDRNLITNNSNTPWWIILNSKEKSMPIQSWWRTYKAWGRLWVIIIFTMLLSGVKMLKWDTTPSGLIRKDLLLAKDPVLWKILIHPKTQAWIWLKRSEVSRLVNLEEAKVVCLALLRDHIMLSMHPTSTSKLNRERPWLI